MWKETQKKLKGAYVDFKKGHGGKYPPPPTPPTPQIKRKKRVTLKGSVRTREERREQNLPLRCGKQNVSQTQEQLLSCG